MRSNSDHYRRAGVDINAGYRAVELMKDSVARTRIPGVLSGLGGFGGLFMPDLSGMKQPVLVSGTDGVGTKLRLAFLLGRHDTVGIDCVAMCVNDILCCGAKPLFFLDYLAVGKNIPEQVAAVVSGVAKGCVQAGCALIGGETAEMPGFYRPGEYDIAGFAVGVVDRERMLGAQQVRSGDVLVALPSSGLHSNGYSLARKVFDVERADLRRPLEELGGDSLGRALLAPTRIYVKAVLPLLESGLVRGIAHITGGGFDENLPRMLPSGLGIRIDRGALRVPKIFDLLRQAGDIPEREMYSTFNMGVGMALALAREDADKALSILRWAGEDAYVLGEVSRDVEGVQL
jgi:phosphoribosylformylglycinamidine cyclo-ligase